MVVWRGNPLWGFMGSLARHFSLDFFDASFRLN